MEMIAEVALKNQAGQYAGVRGAHIVLEKASFDAAQHTFQLYADDTGEKIALKAPNNQFLYAERGGGTWIRPERSQIGGYETFKVLRQTDSTDSLFALQCFSGHYVSMPSNNKVTSTKAIGQDEQFSIVLVSNVTVLLDQRSECTSLIIQNAQLETAKQQIASAQQALVVANKSLQTLVGQLQADLKVHQTTNQATLSKLDNLKAHTHNKAQILEAVEQSIEILTEAQGEAPDVDALLEKIQAEQEQRILVLEIQHQANSASAVASQYADKAQEAATAATLFAIATKQSATNAAASEPHSEEAIAAATAANQAQVAATTAQEQTALAASAKEAARKYTAAALSALGQPDATTTAGTVLKLETELSDENIAQARTAAIAAMAEQAKAQAAAQSAEESRTTAAIAAETAAQQAAQTEQTYDNWSAVSTLFGLTDPAATADEGASETETDPETETDMAETNGLVATDNWSAIATLFGLDSSSLENSSPASNAEEQTTSAITTGTAST